MTADINRAYARYLVTHYIGLCIFPQRIIQALWGRHCCYSPFLEDETELQEGSNLPWKAVDSDQVSLTPGPAFASWNQICDSWSESPQVHVKQLISQESWAALDGDV